MHPTSTKAQLKSVQTLFLPILAGLLTAQIIAVGFVRDSNMHLHDMVSTATDAGYFVIPAGPAAITLTTIKSAIWGGLFFTLSIGVGLTLLTWAALSLWLVLLNGNKWVLRAYLILWVGLLIWVNAHGIMLYPNLFCLLIPLATALVLLNVGNVSPSRRDKLWMVPVATLVMLTAIWATQLNANLFTSIRDHVLLSNPVGRSVNDFYYRYTLYAAESFKSLNQKTIRTYTVAPSSDTRLARQLAQRLTRNDMLYLPNIEHPDFTANVEGPHLRLTTAGGKQIETTLKEMMTKPSHRLQELSRISDHYAPMRRICLFGLLLGFPILLFIMVYSLFFIFIRLFMKTPSATYTASVLCLVTGLLLFIPMLGSNPITISEKNLSQTLTADQWPHRVAALRYIIQKKIDIGHYPQYKSLLASPLVVERYWLARALAASRSPATYNALKSMLGDRQPIVTCQVYYALGRRGNRTAIAPILTQMENSNHWYTQWYGYKALRRLGWYPSQSN